MVDVMHNVEEFYIGFYDEANNLTLLNMTITDKNINEEPIEDIRLLDKNGLNHVFSLTIASSFELWF